MEETIVFVACENEIPLVPESCKKYPIIVTGVGALNAIRFAVTIHPNTKIINVGYCGSKYFKKGTTVCVGKVCMKHKIPFDSPTLVLEKNCPSICYSSSDFEEFTSEDTDFAVYDMELAFIAAVHPNTIGIKTVSDKLNYKEYERFVKSHS